MKALSSLIVVPLIFVAGVTLSTAGTGLDVDLRGGYYADIEEPMLGGGVLAQLSERWFINPNIEYVLVSNGELFTINGDVHYDFPFSDSANWWLGGGIALIHADPDFGSDDTDVGANLLIGIGGTRGAVRPFAQGKLVLSDDSEATIAVGIRF